MTTPKREYDRRRYLVRRASELATRPPDPLLSLTPTELAYIAGLIDGEGSIHTTLRRRSQTVDVLLAIGMTNERTMYWLRDKLRAAACWQNKKPGYLRPQIMLRMQGNRAKLLCSLVRPYLLAKAAHADLVAEFPTEARTGPRATVPPDIATQRLRIRGALQLLNARTGRGHGIHA